MTTEILTQRDAQMGYPIKKTSQREEVPMSKLYEILKEEVKGGKNIPPECVGCTMHKCMNCPYANDYMRMTNGYDLADLYNPDSKLNEALSRGYK